MKIEIYVGDPHNDGHGQYEIFLVESNFNEKDIMKAYKKGTRKVGFDLVKDVCRFYEDYTMPIEKWNKIVELGFVHNETEDIFNEDDVNMNGCLFTDIWIFICKLGNFNLEMRRILNNRPSIEIGGYGLYE